MNPIVLGFLIGAGAYLALIVAPWVWPLRKPEPRQPMRDLREAAPTTIASEARRQRGVW